MSPSGENHQGEKFNTAGGLTPGTSSSASISSASAEDLPEPHAPWTARTSPWSQGAESTTSHNLFTNGARFRRSSRLERSGRSAPKDFHEVAALSEPAAGALACSLRLEASEAPASLDTHSSERLADTSAASARLVILAKVH